MGRKGLRHLTGMNVSVREKDSSLTVMLVLDEEGSGLFGRGTQSSIERRDKYYKAQNVPHHKQFQGGTRMADKDYTEIYVHPMIFDNKSSIAVIQPGLLCVPFEHSKDAILHDLAERATYASWKRMGEAS
uniref:Uncharacterized protein n=1 Tax=Chromera velia CCMP2878 TaxID=1169474 RepID=A0A0G4F145_9ALVE|eukprot:Cvel_2586.t1-p1 / transcript=Cvel_2586.t1 / gene=Cvel_2586 / organism=Chromera_velia_CCMP2878 / gene_product=hypothetical protein / transcript_product=hypothetical protein / location=Cvel_scaffold102:90289-90675(+) / protein_length=129 / sequence_SO=supercontig / SO=protein_coding / is_pseudo=false